MSSFNQPLNGQFQTLSEIGKGFMSEIGIIWAALSGLRESLDLPASPHSEGTYI